jgi:hypothetical protein
MNSDNSPFVQVETDSLRQKLNRFYGDRTAKGASNLRHFQDLWDLKEMAMMERRNIMLVPQAWLEEVDKCDAGCNQ